MLIDCSYFTKGPRHVLNASLGVLPNPNAQEVCESLEAYIEYYQERYLKAVLGHALGNKVHTYLICLEEDGRHNEHFDEVCERLKESYADYVFYQILHHNISQTTITGTVRLKCANDYVSPIQRQVDTWNDMVEVHNEFKEWARSKDCPFDSIVIDEDLVTKINVLNI